MSLLNEYISKRMTANDLEKELLLLIGQYNKFRNTFLIVYSAAISKPIPSISLNMDDYYIIYDLLRKSISKKLDFYLETPGGNGVAAEEIVRFIRSKFENIDFVISGEAKSAGTIMTLSANEILMTNSGSLGLIDAQVRIGRSTVSAYDYIDWVKAKRNFAQKNKRMNPFDATMVAQVSPGELNGVNNALNFAVDLVSDWLPKYKFRNWNQTETKKTQVTEVFKRKRAKEIVKELIDHGKWRTHGRSLKIEDLESIGLKITKIDDDAVLADVVYRIQTVIKLLFNTTNTYKIFATEKEKIFANAVNAGSNALPIIQPKEVEVVNIDIKCEKCGRTHRVYAKFVSNTKIDDDMQKKGFKKFPVNNKLVCDCKFEIDLSGIRNNIETQMGKKFIT